MVTPAPPAPAAAAAAARSGNTGGKGGGEPVPVRPTDPAQNDAAFAVTGSPLYLLVGDGLTPATPSFTVHVTPPAGVEAMDLWLDDAKTPLPFTKGDTDFSVTVDAKPLSLGKHTFMLGKRDAAEGFYKFEFIKGHALYVIISTDWDFSDVDNKVMAHHTELHTKHPALKITHLIGPYTFTDPAVSQARRDEIVAWAKGMRTNYGDEIGLHVHPWCNFVETAGLTCLTGPSFGDLVGAPLGDDTGYTVHLGAYNRQQWNTLFGKAKQIFADVGLGTPTSFRAGGWTLELSTAQALADQGFVVDSSAVAWKFMEEWDGYELYSWNKTQWAPINETSQPYRPTDDRLLPGGNGVAVKLLEVPDNGIMVDYWTVNEMQGVFDLNWKEGAALDKPTQVSTGFHPAPTQYYNPMEYKRLDEFFTYVDKYLASDLKGPVVYINMSDATKVW